MKFFGVTASAWRNNVSALCQCRTCRCVTSAQAESAAAAATPASARRVLGSAREFSNAPGQDEEQPEGREVGVAVGHGLAADLHQADDRHERAQEPEPACQEPGPRLALPERQQAAPQPEPPIASSDQGDRPPATQRIEHRQVVGQTSLPEVTHIRNHRVAHALGSGQPLDRRHARRRLALRQERDHARDSRAGQRTGVSR